MANQEQDLGSDASDVLRNQEVDPETGKLMTDGADSCRVSLSGTLLQTDKPLQIGDEVTFHGKGRVVADGHREYQTQGVRPTATIRVNEFALDGG
jgi:hypothetical protein